MYVIHKRGRIHKNVDALSRVEISLARYLAETMSTVFNLQTDSDGSDLQSKEGKDDKKTIWTP